MLKQGSVKQVRSGDVSKKDGYLVITMCRYPRGLGRELRSEYSKALAPDDALLKDFKKYQAEFGHEEGFVRSHYEERFQLSPDAMKRLSEFSRDSKTEDIFFICQCELGERCHREMLLLLAKEKFGAATGKVFHEYPVFAKRMDEMGKREEESGPDLGPELWN